MSDMSADMEGRIVRIRSFNRMYMQRIGVLAEKIFDSNLSLAEVRVLNELSFRKSTTASALCRELAMDGGYISRILRGFERRGLITKQRAKKDARQRKISLTAKGRKAGDTVLGVAHRKITELLEPVPDADQRRLVEAMDIIDSILNGAVEAPEADWAVRATDWGVRAHRPGDLGRLIHMITACFAADHGWNAHYETMAAQRIAHFMRAFRPERERSWIAEAGGEMLGSLFIAAAANDEAEAEAFLFFVAPKAAGWGVGEKLLEEAIGFARAGGYRRLSLCGETTPDYEAGLFERAGFRAVGDAYHHPYSQKMVNCRWGMDIAP